MQNAHTIVEVPKYLETPTALRRNPQCKVAIGCMYRPPIKIAPALEIYVNRRRVNPLALLAAVIVLAALALA